MQTTVRGPHSRSSQSEFSLDVSSRASIKAFLDEVSTSEFDLVVWLIGKGSANEKDRERYVSTYLTNSLLTIEALLEQLSSRANHKPCFIFMSSRAAKLPSYDFVYSAVKAGVAAGLRSLAARRFVGVHVLTVISSLILGSKMSSEMPEELRQSHILRSANALHTTESFAAALLELYDSRFDYASGEEVWIGAEYL